MSYFVQVLCEGIVDNQGLNRPWTHCAYEYFWKVCQLSSKGIEETLWIIQLHLGPKLFIVSAYT